MSTQAGPTPPDGSAGHATSVPYAGPNALNCVPNPNYSYTTTNLSEAMPGPASPLGWSIWAAPADIAGRAPWYALGAISKREMALPVDVSARTVNIFYGRAAICVNYCCEMGDRIPGATGENLARDAFGFVPPGFVSHPTRRRYPIVMVKQPLSFLRTPLLVARIRSETQTWWEQSIRRIPTLDLVGARALLAEGAASFERALCCQSTVIVCGIQPTFTAVMKLAGKAGVDPNELMRGHGSHEEGEMIDDLWAVSRGRLRLDTFIERHGYYGPNVGEVSNHSWREDPAPLEGVIEGYRKMGEESDPVLASRERGRLREEAEAKLLSGLSSRKDRVMARLVFKMAGRYLPLRSVAKVSFTQSLDIARGSARRIGALFVEDGVLEDPEDIFYLTLPEIQGPLPPNIGGLIAERKAIREAYRRVELPVIFHGTPEVTLTEGAEAEVDVLNGVGVSAGVAEGPIRVVVDPADPEMEPGDILVAHTTDPAWASVMFLAGALVVDIGGLLSHAAVVARELGIPCVMNTGNGTRALHTGDRCRVDGAAGTVEILERATTPGDAAAHKSSGSSEVIHVPEQGATV
jgi:pyruvate, water dikinase